MGDGYIMTIIVRTRRLWASTRINRLYKNPIPPTGKVTHHKLDQVNKGKNNTTGRLLPPWLQWPRKRSGSLMSPSNLPNTHKNWLYHSCASTRMEHVQITTYLGNAWEDVHIKTTDEPFLQNRVRHHCQKICRAAYSIQLKNRVKAWLQTPESSGKRERQTHMVRRDTSNNKPKLESYL